jgi:hypothetical protein
MAEFDFAQIPDDPTKLQDGGGDRCSPGRGMGVIKEYTEYGGANGQAHKLVIEIVAWTVPGDLGKTHEENIFHKDNTGKGHPQKRLTTLAMAAGLFTANDVKRWKAEGTRPDIDMQKLVGRAIMFELEEMEQKDKHDPTKVRKFINVGNIGLGFWHIKDPRCKGWPMNQVVADRVAAQVGDWVVETKQAAKPPAVGASAGNPFAGSV